MEDSIPMWKSHTSAWHDGCYIDSSIQGDNPATRLLRPEGHPLHGLNIDHDRPEFDLLS